MHNGSGSPIEYPTIKIGAEVLTVKVDLLAELLISRANLAFADLVNALRVTSKDPRKLDFAFQLFAACVAHNYQLRGEQAPSADTWAMRIQSLDPAADPNATNPVLVSMFNVITEAVLKRWPSLRAVPETTAQSPTDTDLPKAN